MPKQNRTTHQTRGLIRRRTDAARAPSAHYRFSVRSEFVKWSRVTQLAYQSLDSEGVQRAKILFNVHSDFQTF